MKSLLLLAASLAVLPYLTNAIFADHRPDLYFNGLMVGLQQDTYATSACTGKAPQVKKFVDSLEVVIQNIYLNKTIDMSDLYDPAWELGITMWDVGQTCNFQTYFKKVVDLKFNNVHNNLVKTMPRMIKFVFILAYGLIFDSKADIGEAIGTFIACPTGLYRPA